MGWRYQDMREGEKRVLGIVVVVALICGVGWLSAASRDERTGRNVDQPINELPPSATTTDLSNTLRALQTSGSNSYIRVSIHDYFIPRAHNMFTLSRLYRDHLEFVADPRWRGTENWQILKGAGWIYNDSGIGLVYRFGVLNPCSRIVEEGKQLMADSRGQSSSRICLDGNRLIVEENLYSESTGPLTNRMAAGGICQRGKWGGCILTDGTPARWYVVPRN